MKMAHSNTTRLKVTGMNNYRGGKSKKVEPWLQSIIDRMPEEKFNEMLTHMNTKEKKILLKARGTK
jgi:hypothetical protein